MTAAAERGATLVEALAAAAVLVVGILGLLSAHTVAARQNQMAARQMRGASLALDAVAAVRRWPYDDPRLADDATNDGAVLISGALGDAPPSPLDFELDLNAAPGAFAPPIPAASLDDNEDGDPDFQRYLHVEPLSSSGVQVGIAVSAVVVWRGELGWRQVVMRQSKYDPAGNLATIPGL